MPRLYNPGTRKAVISTKARGIRILLPLIHRDMRGGNDADYYLDVDKKEIDFFADAINSGQVAIEDPKAVKAAEKAAQEEREAKAKAAQEAAQESDEGEDTKDGEESSDEESKGEGTSEEGAEGEGEEEASDEEPNEGSDEEAKPKTRRRRKQG